ncbi:AAA family ATPase [Flavobacterium sp. Arc2]|uniref:AAA family ATPase n=1 Tax=Flavobacterium sp. Arc2 TaxID=3046685 RepID=UPI00352C8D5A
MKFKKVEIQAFRAYDKVEDGTFDFIRKEDGKSADFISLYAPNGFGKTSFYDAIEYGITNNIDRFLRKNNGKDTFNSVKSERSIRSNKNQYFLRNNNSAEDLPSYIKLYKVGEESPIETKIEKPKTKAGYDYKFDPNETINKEFKAVILSQEWIDAFLKEDKPEGRYETFIEYFGDKKIDEYYKKLISLVAFNNKKIETLKKELSGIQLELKFEGDKDILKKVNEKIISLNKVGEHLKKIDESFSETEALNLSNTVSERTSDLNFEIKKATEHNKYLDIFFTGNDEIEGMTKYFESKNQIEKLEKQHKENNSILEKFEKKQKCTNEIDSLKKLNDELSTKKQNFEPLKNDFKEYEKIIKEISTKRKENEELKNELSVIIMSLNVLKQNEIENAQKQSSVQKQISDLEKIISETPKIKESLDNTNVKQQESNAKLVEVEAKIKNLEKEKSLFEIPINNLKTSIQEINTGDYPSDSDEAYTNNAKIIGELRQIEKSLTTENKDLNEIKSKIEASENFQKEVEQFISKGLDIVNKSKASSCPLCEQQYESFSVLTSKISNNRLLSNVLLILLTESEVKNNSITQLNESLKLNRGKLIAEITKKLEEIEKRFATILGDLKKYSQLKLIFKKEIELNTKILNETVLKLNGKTIEAFEKEIQSSLSKLKSEFESFIKKNEELKSSIVSESLKSDNAKEKSFKILAELDRLNKESVYLRVIEFFKVNYPEIEINENVLTDELTKTSSSIKSNADREINLKKEIEDLNTTLNSFKSEDVQKQNTLIEKTKELYIKIITGFEQEVKSKLGIELKQYNLEQFTKFLEDRKKKINEEINKLEFRIKDYNLLAKLKENVTPYLKYEEAKIIEKDTKTRIDFLKNKIAKELDTELKSVADYLTQQIDTFFYEGLINDLYRKIDPHPDYKTVTFKCDFSDTKPKLNVCVYLKKQDELIIPHLYFSTAQLNILSLSIFLAKALNAKDSKGNPLECIFIDDPIQSMDSINILSTIDLLRSIAVNHKKQIILSTHDENFHNLLKKKMPSSLFNSKFMELETFGKVKTSNS